MPEIRPERPDYEPSGKAAKVVDTPKGKPSRQEFGTEFEPVAPHRGAGRTRKGSDKVGKVEERKRIGRTPLQQGARDGNGSGKVGIARKPKGRIAPAKIRTERI
ncbi:hypothetical protein GCM10009864_08220 [Streptomyces lunalinharesii]|uniref:Uncharacterized protein n=1 Tax=Streptomyces lunalinharesii TaxID=333384 RepID=A0ABN3RAA0_9ACTN